MAFNDLSFLFVFFPAVLLLHTLMPLRGKNLILLISSLVFFAWGSPRYVLLMILLILFNYLTGLRMAAQKEAKQSAKFTLISAVVLNLLLLGFFKYWGFLLSNVNAVLGTSFSVRQIPMPLGVSFFTFSILSYLYDVYRDKAPAAKNLLQFSLFVTFFPKLVSGPIVQYSQMQQQLEERTLSRAKFGAGSRLFLIGLAKKVLLSNTLGTTFYAVTALEPGTVSVLTAWLGTVCYALMLYFDFSGYSDMAIGLAQMFGFSFDKNFNYPYMADSITDFWRRWHISLGAWFRDYIYIPMGGSRVSRGKIIRNLLVVWFCTGIWHGASWNFIVWGLYYGLLQILEKFVLKNMAEKLPKPLKHAFTLLLVLIGWVFFFSPTLGSAFRWLGYMFGIGAAGFAGSTAAYYLAGSAAILVIGLLAAFPVMTHLGNQIYHQGRVMLILSVVWFAALLALCIAGMMSSTYSTFLYFQF